MTLLACGATVVLVLTAGSTADAIRAEPAVAAAYLAIALGLGLVNVEVYGRGTETSPSSGLFAARSCFARSTTPTSSGTSSSPGLDGWSSSGVG